MKKTIRVLLALGLALLMLLGDLAPIAAGSGVVISAQAQTLAKNKKKKKATPTPTVSTVKETPAPEAQAERKAEEITPTPLPEGPIIDPQSIADYLFAHGELPENFITKKEARSLGWDSGLDLSKIAPGKSIGGDYFGNYEEKLPVGKGISYREADCYYTRGKRNAYRIIYSSDGRVWYTEDHYNTFEELFPTGP